jgi:hypothetical protein
LEFLIMGCSARRLFSIGVVALVVVTTFGLPFAGGGACSAADVTEKDSAFSPAGVQKQRIFICGHSFHVFVYGLLGEMAKIAGIDDQAMVGVSRIGGSRVIQHWAQPAEKNPIKPALEKGEVDVLTLAPIWLPDEGIENFAKLGLEHNPKIRIVVQEFWLPNDTYEPKYPLDTRKKVDHDATDVAELRKSNEAYAHDIEDLAKKLNEQFKTDVITVVPVGEASVTLREKIVAGTAPGLKKQWDLFTDTWGHAKPALQVLSTYCHFGVIYRKSPVGLPVPRALANDKGIPEADKPALNRLLQEIAWETVSKHPLTGVSTAK